MYSNVNVFRWRFMQKAEYSHVPSVWKVVASPVTLKPLDVLENWHFITEFGTVLINNLQFIHTNGTYKILPISAFQVLNKRCSSRVYQAEWSSVWTNSITWILTSHMETASIASSDDNACSTRTNRRKYIPYWLEKWTERHTDAGCSNRNPGI